MTTPNTTAEVDQRKPPLNGGTLVAAYQPSDTAPYTVLVYIGRGPQPWVTAVAESLDSPTWFWGDYYTDRSTAEAGWLTRSGLL